MNSHFEITEEVRCAHEYLSPSFGALLDHAARSPQGLRPIDYGREAEDPAVKDTYYYPIQAWPMLISHQRMSELADITVGLMRLTRDLPRRAFGRQVERLMTYYGIELDTLDPTFLEPPTGLEHCISRLDFVMTERGLQCVEMNLGGNLGGWQLRFWEPICRQNAFNRQFFETQGIEPFYRDPLRSMLEHIVHQLAQSPWGQRGEDLHLAIGFSAEDLATAQRALDSVQELYRDVLAQEPGNCGGQIWFCEYGKDLELDDEARLSLNGQRLHALVEYAPEDTRPAVYHSLKAGELLLFNGPLSNVLGGKATLALLSELTETDLLDEDEKSLIDRSVPWTRNLCVTETTFRGDSGLLPELAVRHRNDLVLKPSFGTRGEQVHVGRYLAPRRWEELVQKALGSSRWILQQHCSSVPYLYQLGEQGAGEHDVVWGLFAFGETFGGGFLRLNPKIKADNLGVINSATGASEGFIYEI
ncbi:MAG: hypothetical protein AAGD01_07790 [Acidobacteriota bacterium]